MKVYLPDIVGDGEAIVYTYLKRNGFEVKIHPSPDYHEAGFPDLVAEKDGQKIFIEVKNGDSNASWHQNQMDWLASHPDTNYFIAVTKIINRIPGGTEIVFYKVILEENAFV